MGIRLAQMYPQDYYAYVGASQVVNSARAREVGYAWLEQQVTDIDERIDLSMLGQPPFGAHEKFVQYINWIDRYGGFDVRFAELA